MAVVSVLKRGSLKATPQQIPETDSAILATIVRATSGVGSLYADANTTSVLVGTGAAVTTVTVGGGAAYTGGTYGKAAQTETFLGAVNVVGNLTIAGTTTTVNATSIKTSDTLIELGVTTRGTAGANLALAFYGGSNGSLDAMLYWVQASTRFDLGYGDTGATGGTLPSAPTTWVDLKLLNLTVAGTLITGVGASLTMTKASGNVTVSTTTSGTLALTSAGALNSTSAAASTWTHSGGAWALTSTGQSVTISTVTSGTVALTSAGAINFTSAAASTWTHSGGAFAINSTSQGITIATITSGTLALTSAGAVNVTAAAASTWAGSGGTQTFQATSQALTVQTVTSGTLSVLSAGVLTLTGAAASTWSTSAGGLTITSAAAATWSTAAGALQITGTGGLGLTASGATDITFTARSGTAYTFNDGSNTALNAGFVGVTSIIGALNYLFVNGVSNANTLSTSYTNANAGTITQGQTVYISAADSVDLTNVTTDALAGFIGVVVSAAGILTTAAGQIGTEGVQLVRFKIARHVPQIGEEIFLDLANPGYGVSFVQDAAAEPSTAGNAVKSIGFVKGLNGNTGGAVIAGSDKLVYVQIIQGPKTII